MACCCGLNRQARQPQLHPIDDPLTDFDGLKKAIQGVDPELTGFFCTSRTERLDNTKRPEYMPKKGFTPEQVVAKLRQIEVLVRQGKTRQLCRSERSQNNAT
jgi:hypothetical protein